MLEVVKTDPVEQGNAPYWDIKTQSLYFTDKGKTPVIHKYTPASKLHAYVTIDDADCISFIVPIEERPDEFVISAGTDLATIRWKGSVVSDFRRFATVESYPRKILMDGKVAPSGSLMTSSDYPCDKILFHGICQGAGGLYNYQGKVKKLLECNHYNGMAWNFDGTVFYINEPCTRRIFSFDYDLKNNSLCNYYSGNIIGIANRAIAFDFANYDSISSPKGMTVDISENLWVAAFVNVRHEQWTGDNGHVWCINPKTRTLLMKVAVPCPQLISLTFGGPNLDELYVLSSAFYFTKQLKDMYPYSGCLFIIRGTGSKGLPEYPMKLYEQEYIK